MSAPDNASGIKEKLNAERARLLESFKGLPTERLLRLYEGGWSIRDILAHVAMAEAVNGRFAKLIVEKNAATQIRDLKKEYPDFPGQFELNKFNAWMTERWRTKSLVEVLGELHRTRADTLAWLETLTPEQLERKGKHAVWEEQTVKGMFRILVIHDKFHRADIEKRKSADGK